MTKDKKFQMRCTQSFLDTLADLSKGMGVPKGQVVEVCVNIFPAIVELQQKLDKLIKDAKDSL